MGTEFVMVGTINNSNQVVESTDDLEKRLAIAEARVEKLLKQNVELERHKSHLEAVVDGLLNSASWKLTKPLRELVRIKRAVWPIIRCRTRKTEIQAGRNVERSGSEFLIVGPSPYLDLNCPGGHVPTGWLKVRAKLKCPEAHMFFFLYYRSGEGFDDGHRYWLTFEESHQNDQVIKVPADCKGFRLDPFSTKGSFELDDLEFIEIGSLQALANSLRRQLRGAIRNPWMVMGKLRKAWCVLKESGVSGLKAKLFANSQTNNYQEWVDKYDTINDKTREAIRKAIEKLPRKPLISILVPTYNTPEKWLRKAIESVQKQLYPHWELCIADDKSSDAQVRKVIEEYQAKDSRIKSVFRKENGHISRASNSALELATGEYIALLDHDDELTEHALYMMAEEINAHPDAGLIYSDEDKLTGFGMRVNPYFKSDWNPDLLLAQNYICHFSAVRADLMRAVGGFRAGFDGAQDWDLFLRVSEQLEPHQIRHIPHILYHWRIIEGSTAQATAFKPYVLKAQERAVSEHLERRGIVGAEVEVLEAISHLRVRFPIPKHAPLVSLIIPTRDMRSVLERCVNSILEKTTYSRFEVVIVDNGSVEKGTFEYFETIRRYSNVRIIRDEQPFNFSRINNQAAKNCSGELIAFVNNDLEVINPGWLTEMVSHAVRPEIGGVGARLLYPNGLLQHGGIIIGIGGVAGHNHKGRPRHDPGYFNRAILPQDLSALTAACLVMRREVFDLISGFDESLSVAFNDVDLCLRIREKGYYLVYSPYAELYHYESASRGYENTPEKFLRFEGEIEKMKAKWGAALQNDPFYNPNLTLLTEDFALAFPPRARRPWLDR